MPNNVLGYNLTTGRKRHRIHLRLRHPITHELYTYDDIAGTMCHELAHCERAPHDAKFYKITDEIMEQHAIYLSRGLVVDTSGFPINSNFAYVLGGGRGKRQAHGKNAAGEAALQRWERTRILGGTSVLDSKRNRISSSLSRLPPREAARIAAEQRILERKRNDNLHCLPCHEIIEILDESSSDEDEVEVLKGLPLSGQHKKIKQNHVEVINLESSSSNCDSFIASTLSNANHSSKVRESLSDWPCTSCTYENDGIALACKVCGEARIQLVRNKDSAHPWSCHHCTFTNRPLALVCNICYAERTPSMNEHSTNNSTIDSKKRGTRDITDNFSKGKTEKERF